MAPPVRDQHPGTWYKGTPGDTRYMCPFCEWFVDFGEGEMMFGYLRPVLWFGSRAFDRDQFIEKVLEEHVACHVNEMAETSESGK